MGRKDKIDEVNDVSFKETVGEITEELSFREVAERIKGSVFIKDKVVYTHTWAIAEIFRKDHVNVMREVEELRQRYKENKKDMWMLRKVFKDRMNVVCKKPVISGGKLGSVEAQEEVDVWYVDLVFFGVLTSGYISRWGLKVKSAWIESMVSAAVLMRRDEYLCSIGCEELPQSVLGPVLEEIVRKIDVLTVEMAKFMETNKKRELTREEKLYKEIRIGKVKDKVRAIAREKAVELVNAELWRQKELGSQSGEGREGGGSGGSGGSGGGLVYDMKEVYEKEKIEEAERKKQEEEKKNKMFGVKDKNKETQQ